MSTIVFQLHFANRYESNGQAIRMAIMDQWEKTTRQVSSYKSFCGND